eukprot:3043547-Pyramimonas_sp.AAC.1
MSHHLVRGERQCYTNVTPYGQRRVAVLHKCHSFYRSKVETRLTRVSMLTCSARVSILTTDQSEA